MGTGCKFVLALQTSLYNHFILKGRPTQLQSLLFTIDLRVLVSLKFQGVIEGSVEVDIVIRKFRCNQRRDMYNIWLAISAHVAKANSTIVWRLAHLQQCWSLWGSGKAFSALRISRWPNL
jgi:hypothetical protein